MRIIPAIDILDGKCVRLTKGDYNRIKIYHNNPLDVAKKFEQHGIKYLHIVDLDGAKNSNIINYKSLEQIVTKTSLKIDFGGGIKSDESIRIAFECGVEQVVIGSLAVTNTSKFLNWLSKYGPEKIILGADIKHHKIAVQGWEEQTDLEINDFIQDYLTHGIQYILCTAIEKDGTLIGPDIKLYQSLINRFSESIKLISSGGVSSMSDIENLLEIQCHSAIIGKAIYESKITLKELETFQLKHNLC